MKSLAAVPMKFQCPTRVSKENWATLGFYQHAPDAFDVMQTNQNLIVKRIDSAGGWAMDLTFKCCISIKLISITGLRFLSYGPTITPSCYHSNSSSAVTASAGFSPISGILLLSLSTAVIPLSPMSAIVCTVAGFTNIISLSSASASVSTFNENGWPLQTQSNILFQILRSRVVSVVSPALHPSTGHTSVSVHGSNAGFSDWSGRVRVGVTACASTQWRNDNLVTCRISGGDGSNLSVMASVLLNRGTLPLGLSYNLPSPFISATQRLSNISVFGSNFGSYLAVVQRTTTCTNIKISSNSSSFICNSSDLSVRGAGVSVTEAEVSVVFSDVLRLDDVIVSLQSPQGNAYTLMRSKCFGLLPCSQSNSVAFNFQILPIVSTVKVPLVRCSSSGTYAPDDFDASALRVALLSNNVVGNWSLRVAAGSQFLNVTTASIYF